MKANELRIGNYFIDVKGATYGANKNSIQVVHSIKGDGVNEWKEMGFNPVNCKFTDMEPIQLTEEWLVRFGFRKTFDSPFEDFEWTDHNMQLSENIDCYLGKFTQPIKHVHQLQNLYFALIGEELQLTNK